MQNVVGDFCKHVRVHLALPMILRSRLGVAAKHSHARPTMSSRGANFCGCIFGSTKHMSHHCIARNCFFL